MESKMIELTKNYMKDHFLIEEAELPYKEKDGKIIFFVSTYRIKEKIDEKIKKEFGGQIDPNLKLHIEEALKNQVKDEEIKEIKRIIEKKTEYSLPMFRTKGLYKTMIDFFNDESDEGFEKWQTKKVPLLSDLDQAILVEDECVPNPVDPNKGLCGYCGDYIFIRKTKKADESIQKENIGKTDEDDEKGEQTFLQIMNLEQAGLIKYAMEYILGKDNFDEEQKRKFETFWTFSGAKNFKETLRNHRIDKIPELKDKCPKNWLVYRGFLQLQRENIEFRIK